MPTEQEYYEDSSQWGQSQFITLTNIIDNIRLTSSDDSYFKHAEKYRMSILGKQGLKRLNVDLKREEKAISFQVGPNRTFPAPQYMANWNRASVINKCKKLTPLSINNSAEAIDYLQDSEYSLLYDNNGSILKGKNLNLNEGGCYLEFDVCEQIKETNCTSENFYESWIKFNKKENYFVFSDDLVDRVIVLEFHSTGLDELQDCDVKIHHDLELTLTNWIKWKLLEGERNTRKSDVIYFRSQFKIEKERSRALLSDKLSIADIIKSVSLRYTN